MKNSFVTALIMSMKLNEAKLIQEVIENIPIKDSKYFNDIFIKFSGSNVKEFLGIIVFISICASTI